MRRSQIIIESLRELREDVRELKHRTEMMELVFVVKEPDAVRAAEAYDGLRRQVIASNAERRAHLSQLVEMEIACRRAGSVDDVRVRVREWIAQAGIEEVWAPLPAQPWDELFDAAGGSAGEVRVVEPAFVDPETKAVIRRGRVEPLAALQSGPFSERSNQGHEEPVGGFPRSDADSEREAPLPPSDSAQDEARMSGNDPGREGSGDDGSVDGAAKEDEAR